MRYLSSFLYAQRVTHGRGAEQKRCGAYDGKERRPGFMPTNATLKLDLVTPVDVGAFGQEKMKEKSDTLTFEWDTETRLAIQNNWYIYTER